MRSISDMLRHPLAIRAALVVYVLCLVGLITAYFHVTTMDISYSAYIQGPAVFRAGEASALRGVVMDARTGRTLLNIRSLRLELRDAEGLARDLGGAAAGPSGMIHFSARVPAGVKPGTYTLVMRADIDGAAEPFETGGPVRVEAPPEVKPLASAPLPEGESRLIKEMESGQETVDPGVYERSGAVRLEVVPSRLELPSSIPGRFWVRTIDAETGEPLRCDVQLKREAGLGSALPASVKTGLVGLAAVPIKPVSAQTIKLTASCPSAQEGQPARQGTAQVYAAAVASEVSLQLKEPAVLAGSKTGGVVQSLHQSGAILTDVRDLDGRWLSAAAFGLGEGASGVRVTPPGPLGAEPARIVRVQIYTSLFRQGVGWDAQHLLSVGNGQSRGEVVMWLIRRLAAQPGASRAYAYLSGRNAALLSQLDLKQLNELTFAALADIPARFDEPVIVLNNQKADRDKLEAWKADQRAALLSMILLAGLIGLGALAVAVLGYLSASDARRREMARLSEEFEDALSDADPATLDAEALDALSASDPDVALRARRAALLTAVQGALVLATLLMFAGCMVMLLKLL